MRKVIQFVFFVVILFYVIVQWDIEIKQELWEDGSGRVSITYCIPDEYCD